MSAMTFYIFASLTGLWIGTAMALEGDIFKLAGEVAAILPTPVRKTVGALARSSPARTASDALVGLFLGMVCVMYTATFLYVAAVRACGGNCSLACVLCEISDCSETLSLLLLAPAVALFFLRAAGCRSLEVADFNQRPSLLERLQSTSPLILVAAFLLAIISLNLQSPQISDVLGVAAMFFTHLFFTRFYIRAAQALWRMNRRSAIDVLAE
ncbi:hypothetical protein ACQJBY_053335 [Aegilops geniculata]